MANALFTKGCPTAPPPQPDNLVTAKYMLAAIHQKQQQFNGDIRSPTRTENCGLCRLDPAVRVMGVGGGGAAGYLRRHLQKDTFTF